MKPRPSYNILLIAVLLLLLQACERSKLPSLVKGKPERLDVRTYDLELPPDSAGMFQYPIRLGDVNGDGNPDLIVQRLRPNNGIYVAFGDSSLNFKKFAEILKGFGGYPSEQPTLIGDLNGDGADDLLVQKKNHAIWTAVSTKRVFINKQKSYDGGAGVVDMPTFIGDVNGDGCNDVIFHNLFNDLCVAFNMCNTIKDKHKIAFLHHRVIFHMPDKSKHYAIAVADVNGDKLGDFVIFTGKDDGKDWKAHSVYVVPGRGNGQQMGKAYLASKTKVGGFVNEEFPPAVVDVNYDGFPDILVHTYDGTLFALINDHTGKFVLSKTKFCCIGGEPISYYPMQVRTFNAKVGTIACVQRRGDVVLECARLNWPKEKDKAIWMQKKE